MLSLPPTFIFFTLSLPATFHESNSTVSKSNLTFPKSNATITSYLYLPPPLLPTLSTYLIYLFYHIFTCHISQIKFNLFQIDSTFSKLNSAFSNQMLPLPPILTHPSLPYFAYLLYPTFTCYLSQIKFNFFSNRIQLFPSLI